MFMSENNDSKKLNDSSNDKSRKSEKKSRVKGELSDLAKILSGEMALREKEEKMKEMKEKAIKKQKSRTRKKIKKGELELDPVEYEKEITEDKSKDDKKVVQNIELYSWEAPIRTTALFDMRIFMGIVAVSLAFILYLSILGHYGLMAVIIALLFFVYVAGTTEPVEVEHSVTTKGIDSLGKLYEWYMLDEFFFSQKNGEYMMVVETKLRAPSSLIMLLDEEEMAALFVLLQDKLLYKDIRKQSRFHKMTYGEYIPLEEI
jgi:hypothetical protein